METKLTESEMIAGLKARDPKVFEVFIREHKNMVYGVCFKFLRNREEAEDMLQEAFIKVYQKIETFQERSKLSSWLYRIVMNECLMHVRRESKRPKVHQNHEIKYEVFVCGEDTQSLLENSLLGEAIKSAVSELKEKEKNAFVMRLFEEKSNEENAAELGISTAAFKSRFHRSKLRIKRNKILCEFARNMMRKSSGERRCLRG